MVTATKSHFRLQACQRCGGDAYLDVTDDPEWRCLQCGRLVAQPAAARPAAAIAELQAA